MSAVKLPSDLTRLLKGLVRDVENLKRRAVAGPDPVRLVGASGQPAFENGWANYAPNWEPCQFWKDRDGLVHISAMLAGHADGYVFTLPENYAPATYLLRNVKSNLGIGYLQVEPDGHVYVNGGSGAAWVAFNAVFRPAPFTP